jgi:hypothetical protein
VWKEEFSKIDSGKSEEGGNGWISFREFAHYCCKHIVTPEVYCKDVGIVQQAEEVYVPPPKPEPKQIEFAGAIQHEILISVPSATVLRKKTNVSKSKNKNKIGIPAKSKSKNEVQEYTKEIIKTGKNNRKDLTTSEPQQQLVARPKKKKGAKKKVAKTKSRHLESNILILSESCPTLSSPPDASKITVNDEAPDITDAMDEQSSPIEKTCIDIVTLEKKEEDARAKMLAEYVRPMYRARSTADIHCQEDDFHAWVDHKTATTAAAETKCCTSWIPERGIDAFACEREPFSGFGITGVDMVSFTYEMDEVNAEATVHKKYLHRRKPKGNLWEPKYSKRKYKRDEC